MLIRLSIKNIRKSIKDYAIYFFTLVLGVCIFYVFNAIEGQSSMLEVSRTKSDSIDQMVWAISSMSIVVSLILGFLIVYANRFLMKKRNREFGIYLILGMKKGDIAKILFGETLLVGAVSLTAGLLLGIGLSQFMSLLVAHMFEADMGRFVFTVSIPAIGKTILYFVIIYVIVILMDTVLIMKTRLIDLLLSKKKNEKVHLKNPVICCIIFVAACIMLGTAYYNVTAGQLDTEAEVMIQILLGIVGTFLVFWSVSGALFQIMKKCSGIYYKRLNSFAFSEIRSQVNTSVAAGTIICLLLFATICILSSAFALKDYKAKQVKKVAGISVSMEKWTTDGKTVRDVLEKSEFDFSAFQDCHEFYTYETREVTMKDLMGSAGEELLKDEAIDIVVGSNRKSEIVHIIEEYYAGKDHSYLSDISKSCEYDDMEMSSLAERTRAFIKIQDGCNQFCTYCIIPYARGRIRSRKLEDIRQEVEKLAANGYQEVVLTGIHLSSYGRDQEENVTLSDAIRVVSEVEGIKRIRLGSLEQGIITEEFVRELSENPKFCPQFHLSLQSGSETVLKRMNRHYTPQQYEEKCNVIRRYFKNPAFTTDIIVGFPAETEEEFEETMQFAEQIGFSKIHIFKYSMRKGTPAARWNTR